MQPVGCGRGFGSVPGEFAATRKPLPLRMQIGEEVAPSFAVSDREQRSLDNPCRETALFEREVHSVDPVILRSVVPRMIF